MEWSRYTAKELLTAAAMLRREVPDTSPSWGKFLEAHLALHEALHRDRFKPVRFYAAADEENYPSWLCPSCALMAERAGTIDRQAVLDWGSIGDPHDCEECEYECEDEFALAELMAEYGIQGE